MSIPDQKQDVNADEDVQQQGDEAQAEGADGGDADAATADAQAEEEAAKEQITPSLTVTSPGSGAQFAAGEQIAIEFDAEGDTEFKAHASVVDAGGNEVVSDEADLVLEENKGHGTLSVGGDALIAGKYDVLVWGDSNGQATAVQKLQVEVVDTEAEEEPAPAVAVEGDDDGDDAVA